MSMENGQENNRTLRAADFGFKKHKKFVGLPIVSVHLNVDTMLICEIPIRTAKEAIALVANRIYDRAIEEASAIFFDDSLAPICIATVGCGGTTDGVFFSPRDIVQTALLCNAAYVTIVHNHPGINAGKAKCVPSKEDIAMTDAIIDACNVVNVKVYDSIIVSAYKETPKSKGEPVYYSVREHNFRRLVRRSGLTYKKEKETDENKLSFERGEEHNTRGGRVPDIKRETEGIRYITGEMEES